MNFDLVHSTFLWCDKKQIHFSYKEITDSTQILAKNEISSDRSLFFTTIQTAGRGRGQNQWINTATPNQLFLSTWKLHTPKAIQPVFSCKIGLVLYNALRTAWPLGAFSIKAPNDVFLDDKKVSGLLIESTLHENQNVFFIGLGLNVLNGPDLPTATSLFDSDLMIDEISWWNFLENFSSGLKKEIDRVDQKLDQKTCNNLIQAMNLFPHKKAEIINIDSDGNIFTANERISWLDL